MTAPRHAVATESGRYYSIPGYENTPFRSVTNIIGIIDKPAIAGAAAKRAGERAIACETEWHAIQQEEYDSLANNPRIKDRTPKTLQKWANEAARLWISAAGRQYGDYTSDQGSAVHCACEHFEQHVTVVDGQAVFDEWLIAKVAPWAEAMTVWDGTTDKNIERIRKHVTQYAKAIDEKGIVFLDRERTVCHPEHGYAGTLDGIVTLGEGAMRRTYVLDIKTGGLYPESIALQISSYRYATHEVHGDKTSERKVHIDGGCVLQLKPASYTFEFVKCDKPVFERFLDAMSLWTWRHEESRSALGGEWR
jgi:hypothetical protein